MKVPPWGRAPLFLLLLTALGNVARSESIPFAGNAFRTAGGSDRGGRDGLRWDRPDTMLSVFFHIDRPASLQLALRARVPEGTSRIRMQVGDSVHVAPLTSPDLTETPLGEVRIDAAGYVRVDFQGLDKTGPVFAQPEALLVRSTTPGLTLAFVRDNIDNRYYWGRRGPSVHLGYRMPEGRRWEWFHSELTVPEGLDPVGSFYMANGFGEGYFGMQVNSPVERRILFSVWSPFATDNPREIPEDQRIVVLARGEGVHTGEFGNEGSGGQSYLRHPWVPGRPYRFLNRARPDGRGNTIYTAWFLPPDSPRWHLIASFRRPHTDKHLTGLHGFLENFADRQGWLPREGRFGNAWARDTDGQWHRLLEARFTGDDIARRGYRLDFAGGVLDPDFFLRNGGFASGHIPLNTWFQLADTGRPAPEIPFEALEGVQAGLDGWSAPGESPP
ncbi:MAG: DUF3472 domain-containing protein [Verrucomicrobiae bacterium]|nr:DUF3472 domain-containing protein [Verrucomicrobiae bacterium]